MLPKLFNADPKTNDRIWMAWIITLIVGLVGTLMGVQFPIPPLPTEAPVSAQGVTNLDMLHLAAPTTVATATPALMVDCYGLGNCIEVRDAATPVFAINDGGAVDFASSVQLGTGNRYPVEYATSAELAYLGVTAAFTGTTQILSTTHGCTTSVRKKSAVEPPPWNGRTKSC